MSKIKIQKDFQKPKRKLGKVYPTNETVIKNIVSKSIKIFNQNENVSKFDILSKLKHHKMHIRKNAIHQIHETILSTMNETDWSRHAATLLPSITKLFLDPEREIRLYLLQILKSPIFPFYPNIILQFQNWIMTILSLGLTHLQQDIAQDTILYMNAFIQYAPYTFQPCHYLDLFTKIKVSILERYQQHQLSNKIRMNILECMKRFIVYRTSNSKNQSNNTESTIVNAIWASNMKSLNIFSLNLDAISLYEPILFNQPCIFNSLLIESGNIDQIDFAEVPKDSQWIQESHSNLNSSLLSSFIKEMFIVK